MFTIMHRQMDGSEELFSAVEVQYIPETDGAGQTAGLHLLAGPDQAGPGVRCGKLTDGTVFVMNDKGATVGRFYLDKPRSTVER